VINESNFLIRTSKNVSGRIAPRHNVGAIRYDVSSYRTPGEAVTERDVIAGRAIDETGYSVKIILDNIVEKYKLSGRPAVAGNYISRLLDGIVFNRDRLSPIYL
jgi:hypothetical protein